MKSNSLFALLAGAAAGLTLGVLFAPDKGEETRAKIKKAAENGYDDLKEITEETAHDLHVRARYARREMNALKKTLSEGRCQGETPRAALQVGESPQQGRR